MATPIYKVLIFLKRRPGMSMDEFRDYYEGVHAKLAVKYAVGLKRYLRRYIEPLRYASKEPPPEMEFDVITELWFEDKAIFDNVVKFAARGVLPDDILVDEERVFDRPKTRYATVIEAESAL